MAWSIPLTPNNAQGGHRQHLKQWKQRIPEEVNGFAPDVLDALARLVTELVRFLGHDDYEQIVS